MILGIGNDICEIERIEKALHRYGKRFEERIFTKKERLRARESADIAAIYAKRFAAKEAAAKALGCGVWRDGVSWHDFEILNEVRQKPELILKGEALVVARNMVSSETEIRVHLSLSDDAGLAQAFVIIEAI